MMDSLHAAYLEETEELLQQAEECLIRLETGCSGDDINALFRIFHSIKGSSQMIGYDDIGNLTHKMEDMLDIVRKGRIDLDGQILQLCFSGLDHVKRLFESKKSMIGSGRRDDFVYSAGILEGEIDQILSVHSQTEQRGKDAPRGDGIVSALKEMERTGKNRYYICVSFSDDVPMISPVLFMIFNNIKEIGSLVYASVSDEDIYEASAAANLSSLAMIVDSDLEEAELYTYLDVTYVEKAAVADISEQRMLKQAMPFDRDTRKFFEVFFQEYPKLYPVLFHNRNFSHQTEFAEFVRERHQNIDAEADRIPGNPMVQHLLRELAAFCDLCLDAAEGKRAPDDPSAELLRKKYLELFETAYGHVRGKFFYKIFKAKTGRFMEGLDGFVERMDKSCTRNLLLDLSRLEMIDEQELKRLIALKRRLNGMGIALRVIIGHFLRKRMINIFDAIRTIEHFELFDTEVGAALGETIDFNG